MTGDDRHTDWAYNHTVNHDTQYDAPTENINSAAADGEIIPGNGACAVATNEGGGCTAFTHDCPLV